jgi:uncharacterized protein YkwD
MKTKRTKQVVFLLIVVLVFCIFFARVHAFSLNLNPIPFIQKTAETITNRVSDIIYYLVMQKRYVFDGYTDPNTYQNISISPNVENILKTATSSSSYPTVNNLIAIATSVPNIKITDPAVAINNQNQVTPFTTGLIVNQDNSNYFPALTDNSYTNNSEILTYTNQERGKVSLSPLSPNQTLDQVASLRADDLFNNQYFDHASPDGKSVSDLISQVGYSYLLIGENLALGNFGNAKNIVSAWMDSPGHRANILNDRYKELGVAVKSGTFNGDDVIIAVQIFGLPQANCSKPSPIKKDLLDNTSVSVKQMQTEALVMYQNLTLIKNNPELNQAYYLQKVQEYNYFAKKVNDAVAAMKLLVDSYNQEVARYNLCINPE